jgi:hypothetical protein
MDIDYEYNLEALIHRGNVDHFTAFGSRYHLVDLSGLHASCVRSSALFRAIRLPRFVRALPST